MASHIERRKFLATLGGAAAVWPLAARAQQPERMRRIGILMNRAPDSPAPMASIRPSSTPPTIAPVRLPMPPNTAAVKAFSPGRKPIVCCAVP